MESTATYARPELLQVADTVARDKGIDKDEVLEAMEQAIQKAGRSKYGQEYDIRAEIDRRSGEIRLLRFREVVEEVENEATQMPLPAAKRLNAEAEIGDFITDPLPPIDFGRIAAQTAKQVIVQKVRDAERQRQYAEFKDRVGEIVNGLVKRVEFGNVVVDLGRAEAMLRRDELLPRESYRQGERVRSYVFEVRPETRGPQIFLSRTRPEFMAKLFAQEVPEIYDGIIEIKSVARDPGSRAKIAVLSRDSGIDPVGACVGMRGSRVQAVVGELQGEKIDIIPWSSDPATFVVNGLAPAEVSKVVMDEEQRRIEVVVPDDQLSLAIGRRGQNVRLASQLTGWDIDILTEAEESERRTEEFRSRSQMFIDALDIDDVIAHLLVTEGFGSLEEVAYVGLEDLAGIEGFDEEIAAELQERARYALERRDREYEERYRQLGVEDDLVSLEGLTPGMLVTLAESGIKTLDDFAGLAGDELVEMLGGSDKGGAALEPDEANALIMEARERAHWFDDAGAAGKQGVEATAFHVEHAAPDAAATGAPETAASPQRRCIATGEVHDRARLVRFVIGPDGAVVPDIDERLPGRGLWLLPHRDIVESCRGKAGIRPRCPAAGLGTARPRGPAGKFAGPALCRLARPCQAGRFGGCRVRSGLRRGPTGSSRRAAVRSGRRDRRPGESWPGWREICRASRP